MLHFMHLHPRAEDLLGFIPEFLDPNDTRSAQQQLDENYRHGGGFHPMKGWAFTPHTNTLKYPGDPPIRPIAAATLRDETILVYPSAWVCIVQTDGAFVVARMD